MSTMPTTPEHFTRFKPPYLITSDSSHLPLTAINNAFASPSMWWCTALPLPTLKTCLDSSFCLGLYKSHHKEPVTIAPASTSHSSTDNLRQIGLARVITDHTTMAYLTDVYVIEEEQGQGLGKWLIECVNAWANEMPHLRRLFLIGREGVGEEFYGEMLGTERFEQGLNGSMMLAKRGPALRKPV